jgi:hypothetical protein
VTERKLIFITGASRSGTTLLSFVLRNNPAVFGLEELQYFGRSWDPRRGRRHFSRSEAIEAAAALFACQEQGVLVYKVGPQHRRAAATLVDGLGPGAADPAAVFAGAVHQIARVAGRHIPCEQTPRNIFYARALLQIYPAAHVVHIVRDPRAVMASQKQRWRHPKARMVPRTRSFRVWVNYHPYTMARLWFQATRAALELADHPRFTLLRFEDLVTAPEATVRALCTRLGLEYDARMLQVKQINSSHHSSAGDQRTGLRPEAIHVWRQVLSPSEIAIAERHCAPLMARFGYDCVAPGDLTFASRMRHEVSYLAHVCGVVLVNPRRAWVQARALAHPGSAGSGHGRELPP